MKLKALKSVPFLIALGVIVLVCAAESTKLFERLEWITYDWRVRVAAGVDSPSSNLGYVYIDNESISEVNNGLVGSKVGLYWPRQIYGRLVRELAAQGAKGVAFDVLFGELRHDHPSVIMADGTPVDSDDYFATQIREAGNVILAATENIVPPPLFLTNAWALGHISTGKDTDGILRRAKPFVVSTNWHPYFQRAASEYELQLDLARIEQGRIMLPQRGGKEVPFPLDDEGKFTLTDLYESDNAPPGMEQKAKPFTKERIWSLGIALAARELNLDLANADVDLVRRRIVLKSPEGKQRIIPVDEDGFFYIDWGLREADSRLTRESFRSLLVHHLAREAGETNIPSEEWRGKLVVVGSTATGQDLADLGPTPLEKETHLMSKHWNVANSILQDRIIFRWPLSARLGLIVVIGAMTALLTWKLSAIRASVAVGSLSAALVGAALYLYVRHRVWMPMATPLWGSFVMMFTCLLAYKVRTEQAARQHIKSLFARMVSPNIVNVLLEAGKLPALGGTRKELTVLFADIRGFTEMTDLTQSRVDQYVRERGLGGAEAEAFSNEQARETLSTVNLYLATIADMVKKHDGTLDKYIGDCVMAFWGAPLPDPKHALACVRASIEAQRAIYRVNEDRKQENQSREKENEARAAAGEVALPSLAILQMGTGINTGMATVGLMGSEEHIRNFTVFGREVNLASRLESESGHGRILIGETTYEHLKRDDPELAARCEALPPVKVKGIRSAVKVFKVPWESEFMIAGVTSGAGVPKRAESMQA